MSNAIIRLKKGLNIRMQGVAEPILETASDSEIYALKPTDFPGLTPRLSVKQGDEIMGGEPLFYDKYDPEVVFVSPAGGRVAEIVRGERRKILEVIVKKEPGKGKIEFEKADPLLMYKEQVKERLLKSGLWPFLKRRPYGIIARPHETPKEIFISCFDTAPLAPDYHFILKGEESAFQTGINALTKLTEGKVHLGVSAENHSFFGGFKNVETTLFSGPHPAGNVGVQIHHCSPVNKGEVVWTINPQDLLFLGRLFEKGYVDFSRIVALTGSEVMKPRYFRTSLGASLQTLLRGNVSSDKELRVISGNVLNGTKVDPEGFLSFLDSHITVVPEGNYFEFLGWAKPRLNKFSMSRAYFSWFKPRKVYTPDTNLNGEKRAYVMTGEYEKVLPMDILPVQLIKAVIAGDIDKMEQLGIYEVIGEDLALCEYVCTSKIEVQAILQKGIDMMIRELG